jgi:lysophospholipase L1-like esterase
MIPLHRLFTLCFTSWLLCCTWLQAEIGQDVAAVFQRAKAGAPLRYVALGGSITQAGKGWIGPWLQQQFPDSEVSIINSGMSGTGSALGVFRVERDVIAHQPDLVLLEYCVNDGSVSDEDAIRNMESLVVRLKSLPNPPAIIILEVAAREGADLSRHRKVAQHYGLLEIDVQAAVVAKMESSELDWNQFFSDAVHPNTTGHAFYAKVIEAALERYLDLDAPFVEPTLPEPLSALPLVLDGRMVKLAEFSNAAGWRTENSLPHWWNRFFNGVLVSNQPTAALNLPFRGTQVGLFFAMNQSYGSFYVSVDGEEPEHVFTNTRGGFNYKIFAQDLEANEHLLTLVLPPESAPETKMNGPVKLGYLLLAGETGASRKQASRAHFSAADIADRRYEAVPFDDWKWLGPYSLGADALHAGNLLHVNFDPELDFDSTQWQGVPGEQVYTLDFQQLTGEQKPSVAYVSGSIESEKAERVLLALRVDYFAKIWLNGELLATIDTGHGNPREFYFTPAYLNAGQNDFMIKVAAGSAGHSLELSLFRSREVAAMSRN